MGGDATGNSIPSAPLPSARTGDVNLTPAAPGPDRVLARVADGCALAVIGIGLLAMAGWLFGIEPLTRVLPHLQ
jgi:hypothetical protein